MDRNQALLLARVSAAVYQPDRLHSRAAGSFHMHQFAFAEYATACLLSDDTQIVLAFRGSIALENLLDSPGHLLAGLRDWGSNVDCRLERRTGWPGLICRGWADCLQFGSGLQELHTALLDHGAGAKPVWLTGHSLGGALAILQAHRLHTAPNGQSFSVAGVYTFGTPRPGNKDFALGYGPPVYRFENRHDPVPLLPASLSDDDAWSGYTTPGALYYFNREGVLEGPVSSRDLTAHYALRFATRLWDGSLGIDDHAIASYIARLESNLDG